MTKLKSTKVTWTQTSNTSPFTPKSHTLLGHMGGTTPRFYLSSTLTTTIHSYRAHGIWFDRMTNLLPHECTRTCIYTKSSKSFIPKPPIFDQHVYRIVWKVFIGPVGNSVLLFPPGNTSSPASWRGHFLLMLASQLERQKPLGEGLLGQPSAGGLEDTFCASERDRLHFLLGCPPPSCR